MSTLKKIVSIILVLALCLAVVGCSGEDSYTSERELAENEQTGELKTEYEVSATDLATPDGYAVIYPKGNEQLRQAASKLVTYFADNGVNVTLMAASISLDLGIGPLVLTGRTRLSEPEILTLEVKVRIGSKHSLIA